MKISKQKLKQIIYEECGYSAMRDDMSPMAPPTLPNGEVDKEGRMAKRQLQDIAEYANELSGMLQDETQLEAWVQSKLTKAADYIKTVKHYVEYGMEEGAYDQVAPQMDPIEITKVEMSDEMTPMSGYEAVPVGMDDEEFEY